MAAALAGGCVLVPSALVGQGAAIRLKDALSTKRPMPVSARFRTAHPSLGRVILDSMSSRPHAWSLIATPAEYADHKARVTRAGAAARALALVSVPEMDVFDAAACANISHTERWSWGPAGLKVRQQSPALRSVAGACVGG